MRKKKITLQQSEWIVMEKLWENSPKTVIQLYHELDEEMCWSKKAVDILLDRMADRGIIHYEEEEKTKQYYPDINREEAALTGIDGLLNRVFKGSASRMRHTVMRREKLSQEEIEMLYQLLEELDDE